VWELSSIYGTSGKWYFSRRWSGVTSTMSIAAGIGGIYVMIDERGCDDTV
jgi:hypothetical protein